MGVLNPTLEKIYSFHKEREIAVLSFRAFGTSCKVKYSPLDSIDYESVSQQVIQWVQGFEQRYSRYLENSWLSLVNASAGVKPIPLTQEDENLRAASLFQSKQRLTHPVCLSPLFGKRQNKNQLPQEHEISEAKELVNWDNVQISREIIYLPGNGT